MIVSVILATILTMLVIGYVGVDFYQTYKFNKLMKELREVYGDYKGGNK